MKALVIGFGSIGKRHARLLVQIGLDLAVLSSREIGMRRYTNLSEALEEYEPDYVIIANKTNEHYEAIKTLAECGFKGRLLIEKPLFDHILEMPLNSFKLVSVGYNLRFHPLVAKLKTFLNDEKVITASFYVGNYLPSWRPGIDYRKSYSADKELGGGVLRDLSHELDLALWLFGKWSALTANGGRFSELEITSDDCYSILLQTEKCSSVTIQMNYLDRVARREILINTISDTIRVELNQNLFEINGVSESVQFERDETYEAQHLQMVRGETGNLCTLEEAEETLFTIESVEKAALSKTWIKR